MDQRIKKLVHFDVAKKDENFIAASFKVHEDLPSFEGHFPGHPILPAVSIIDISLYLVSYVAPQVSHTNIEVKRSKFTATIQPGQEVEIEAQSSDGTNWKVHWRQKTDQAKLAQVHLVV